MSNLRILICLIIFPYSICISAEKPFMAVIVQSPDMAENEILTFENRLISGLSKTKMYSLIERRELETILNELKLQNSSGLVDAKYAIEIGNFIGV